MSPSTTALRTSTLTSCQRLVSILFTSVISTIELKEIKLRPVTETHDYNFKIKNAKKFIVKGDKVKFTVKFKGREMQHTDLGKDLMKL